MFRGKLVPERPVDPPYPMDRPVDAGWPMVGRLLDSAEGPLLELELSAEKVAQLTGPDGMLHIRVTPPSGS
jgi:hypothetical protein